LASIRFHETYVKGLMKSPSSTPYPKYPICEGAIGSRPTSLASDITCQAEWISSEVTSIMHSPTARRHSKRKCRYT